MNLLYRRVHVYVFNSDSLPPFFLLLLLFLAAIHLFNEMRRGKYRMNRRFLFDTYADVFFFLCPKKTTDEAARASTNEIDALASHEQDRLVAG